MFNDNMTKDRILKVTVTFERRKDGGLRAYSDDVPGLMLSGNDSEAVFEDVIPALETLCRHNLKINAHFLPIVDVKHALQERGFLPPSDPIAHIEYAAALHANQAAAVIAVRMHPRESWEGALRACECRPCEGLGPLNTAEWWVSSWGFLFTVPIEGPDERVGERELEQLLEMINRSKPN